MVASSRQCKCLVPVGIWIIPTIDRSSANFESISISTERQQSALPWRKKEKKVGDNVKMDSSSSANRPTDHLHAPQHRRVHHDSRPL